MLDGVIIIIKLQMNEFEREREKRGKVCRWGGVERMRTTMHGCFLK